MFKPQSAAHIGVPVLAVTMVTTLASATLAAGGPAVPVQEESEGLTYPRLKLERKEVAIPPFWQGETGSAAVRIENVGRAPLEIREITVNCTCTKGEVVDATLAPGQATELRLTADSSRGPGRGAVVARIHSNDPIEPVQQLGVRFHVRSILVADPTQTIKFGRVPAGAKATRSIEIRNEHEAPLKLKLAPVEDLPLACELTELEPGRRWKLTVATRPPLREGFLKSALILKTDSKRLEQIDVPVTAFVQPAVAVTPPSVYKPRGYIRPSRQTVLVTWDRTLDMQVTGVKVVGADNIKAVLGPKTSPADDDFVRSRNVYVELPAGREMPSGEAWMEIATTHPEYPTLKVPFTDKRIIYSEKARKRAAQAGQDHAGEGDGGSGGGETP